jgi:hypothetical protein
MLTPEEYIEMKPESVWIHALDVLDHCLRGVVENTAYGCTSASTSHLNDLKDAMGTKDEGKKFNEILKDTFRKTPKAKPRMADEGDLVLDSYLNGEERCFEEFFKENVYSAATTVVMDIAIAAAERDGPEMEIRHEKIYKIACDAEAKGDPCRVIAAAGVDIPETEDPIKLLFVIKDYDDPIFPGIWGAMETNATTNTFLNVVMDYLVGTHSTGNGSPAVIDLSDEVPPDEDVIVLNSRRIIYRGGS